MKLLYHLLHAMSLGYEFCFPKFYLCGLRRQKQTFCRNFFQIKHPLQTFLNLSIFTEVDGFLYLQNAQQSLIFHLSLAQQIKSTGEVARNKGESLSKEKSEEKTFLLPTPNLPSFLPLIFIILLFCSLDDALRKEGRLLTLYIFQTLFIADLDYILISRFQMIMTFIEQ